MFILELLPFLFSSLLSLGLIYYKIPLNVLQQINAVILVILLVVLGKNFKTKQPIIINLKVKLVTVSLGSLFVQLLVLSTGGFFSPFLILLHLFTLGVSILFDFGSSISFLIFSVLVLIISTRLNSDLAKFFQEDPGSIILYLASFIVIIPLAYFVTRTYHLKDILSKKLTNYLNLSKGREASILEGLNELVIIADVNLNILSVNQTAEKTFNIENWDVVKKPLADIIPLVDEKGQKPTIQTLSINNILKDKAVRIINGFSLKLKNIPRATKVTIQIRPVLGSNGVISQLVFVIKDFQSSTQTASHPDLEQSKVKNKLLFEDIKKSLLNLDHPLEIKFELYNKSEEDLLLTQEIEDHSLSGTTQFEDIALVCKRILGQKQNFAKNLSVPTNFTIAKNEVNEITYLNLKETNSPLSASAISDFATQVNIYWFEVLISKLLDICLLLSSSQRKPFVEMAVSREGDKNIVIQFLANLSPDFKTDPKQVFEQYFGTLGKQTNLALGSGLEGFMAKNIADQFSMPLTVEFNQYNSRLTFTLKVTKTPFNSNQAQHF